MSNTPTTTNPPTLSRSKRAASQISRGAPDGRGQQAADGTTTNAKSKSTKAQRKANTDTKHLLDNDENGDDNEITPVEPPQQKKSSNNTEQWNQNYKDVLAFAEAHGHLKLPSSNQKTRRLANWLRLQSYRAQLPSCQREKLKDLEPYRDMQNREEKE
jgi:hypothetical protein